MAPLTRQQIAEIRGRFEPVRPQFDQLAREASALAQEGLRDHGIRCMVTSRAKRADSLERSLWRDREEYSFEQFDTGLAPPLLDLAGVRALLYLPQEMDQAVAVLSETFAVEKKKQKRSVNSPYFADHLQARLKGAGNLAAHWFEMQVCPLTHHIWNELEHDIKYKQPQGSPSHRQEELLHALDGALGLATRTVERLMTQTREREAENSVSLASPDQLRRYVESRIGRAARGDFESLLRLLRLLNNEVTPKIIDQRLREGMALAEAERVCTQLDDIGASGEVGWFTLALLPAFGPDDIREQIKAGSDRPPLWRLVAKALDAATPKK